MEKKYTILIRDIYTDEERVEHIPVSSVNDVRGVHKESLKLLNRQEDIEEIHLEDKLLYTIGEGFLD